MSERLNGTHEVAGKPALRDNLPLHGTANEGMGRPQSSTRSDDRAGAEAQEACKRLELYCGRRYTGAPTTSNWSSVCSPSRRHD